MEIITYSQNKIKYKYKNTHLLDNYSKFYKLTISLFYQRSRFYFNLKYIIAYCNRCNY
jgi:hypothetical protein